MAPLASNTLGIADHAARTTNQLFRVVLEALFEEGINFVQPTSLCEVRNLRLHPDISAFRQTFLPWLAKLVAEEETPPALRS